MDLAIIAAVAEDRTIGDGGKIPWHYSADMEHFKRETMGHPVIMGKGTWDSLESYRPLPGRTNIVMSFEPIAVPDGVVNVHGIEEAVDAAEATGADEAYVIGGAAIYDLFLDRADRMVLTEIPGEYGGDTRFPEWDRDAWTAVAREEDGELAFVTYERA